MGQLGDGTTADRALPTRVAGGLTFQSLVTGANFTCGLDVGGAAYCWGWYGLTSSAPVAVAAAFRFRTIAVGTEHTCGVATTGVTYCWGDNRFGQVGIGSYSPQYVPDPVPVTGGLTFVTVAAGMERSCGLTSDGSAYCWGDGILGNGNTVGSPTPVQVTGGFSFQSLAMGGAICGLVSDGSAYCWGSGPLGNGTSTPRPSPIGVSGSHHFLNLSTRYGHACGAATDGIAYCWGSNSGGTLGDGTNVDRSVPGPVRSW